MLEMVLISHKQILVFAFRDFLDSHRSELRVTRGSWRGPVQRRWRRVPLPMTEGEELSGQLIVEADRMEP